MTRVVVLTPAGTGAIATIAVVGPGSWDVVRRHFRPASGKPLPDVPGTGRTWYGKLGDGAGDEVVIAATRLEPEPQVEIHGHGGRRVVRWLVEQFVKSGCVEVPWTELVVLSGGSGWSGDPRALEPLTRAATTRTAAILLDQYHGAFTRTVAEALQAPDRNFTSTVADLARFAGIGRHLVVPWQVVVTGPPNVGKSSLVNALAGYQRSIVTPVPGTTRDLVTVSLALEGWPVEVSDTAGLRETFDELEGVGVVRAREAVERADLVVRVLDGSEPADPAPSATRLAGLTVINKSDLEDARPDRTGLRVSALTGAGLGEFIETIVRRLIPSPPVAGAAVPYSSVLADLVGEAHLLVTSGNVTAAREILARCLR